MSGQLAGGVAFTLRYDWDEVHHFHVNAMRGSERRLYKYDQIESFDTELQARQRYDTLTEKIGALGDQGAAEWFMAS